MRKTRYVLMWFVVLITSMLLAPFAEASTVVTKYPPYAYAEMSTESGGWLGSCKKSIELKSTMIRATCMFTCGLKVSFGKLITL